MKTTAIPRDTDLKSARYRYSILRRKSASDRAAMAMELSDSIRETVDAGIKKRHPDYSEDMIRLEFLRRIVEKHVFERYCLSVKGKT